MKRGLTNRASMRRRRERGVNGHGKANGCVNISGGGSTPCSGGQCPQPVLNGYPGQGNREGRVPEHSLLHVKNVVWAGREGEKAGSRARKGWRC